MLISFFLYFNYVDIILNFFDIINILDNQSVNQPMTVIS